MEYAGPSAERPASRRILIVDDEPKICAFLSEYFRMRRYTVRPVGNGEEALALAAIFHPDVVLLDLLMPGLSGVEVLKRLKQLAPPPRVIMLSSADLQDVAEGALQLGADAYMCKPADLQQLERLISGFWPSKHPRTETR